MTASFKSDFPIFANNPGLVYLDNGATTQKPAHVIDGIKKYLEHDYANIHRGSYQLSERSERIYDQSKEKVAQYIGARFASEIIYTYNANYALNLLAASLAKSHMLQKGDRVLLSIAEHHANVVPWLMLKDSLGIEVDFFGMTPEFDIDFTDFASKYTPQTKVVSTTFVSNVTGSIFALSKLSALLRDDTLFIVDASQAIPNFSLSVQELDCDFCFFAAHKVMADTGLGVLYGKKELLKNLTPAFIGGGSINWVDESGFESAGLPLRFETGTPNLTGAASLLYAFEYIESIWGYSTIEKQEKMLVEHALKRIQDLPPTVRLVGKTTPQDRVGVFTFLVEWKHPRDISDALSEKNICVRAGFHCAEPLLRPLSQAGSIRMSVYFYNDIADIDAFFDEFIFLTR